MKRFSVLALLGSLGLAAAVMPASAGEMLPSATARQLDTQPLEFTQSAAKMRRMQIIEETMARNRYERRGRGYGRGDGYGRYDGPRRGYYGDGPRRGYYGRPGGYYGQGRGVHPGTGYPPGYYGR